MTTENRPTSITAAQWHTIAADVEAGRCEVWDYDMPEPAQIDDIYYYTTPTEIVYQMHYADVDDMSDTVQCYEHSVFAVRWLDTAPNLAPARPTTIRADQWALVAEDVKAGRCEVWDDYPYSKIVSITNVTFGGNWPMTVTVDKGKHKIFGVREDYEMRVDWIDTAPASDAGAGESGMDNHDLKMWALNMENVDDKRVLLAIDRLITENATMRQQLADAQAQVAAAREALDFLADQTDALLLDNPSVVNGTIQKALNEASRYLNNAEKQATPQPSPVNSELVAAVERVIALAPHNRPEMGDLTTMNNQMTQITTIARFESEQAYWRVATILKTALKAGEA